MVQWDQEVASSDISFLQNVKEHAPPLAGASVETGVGVHNTGDLADKTASSGCCGSTCSALPVIWDQVDNCVSIT